MFSGIVIGKCRGIWFHGVRFGHREAGCIWMGYGPAQVYVSAVTFFIGLFGDPHRGSSRSVAYLEIARLERSRERWRREGELTNLSILLKESARMPASSTTGPSFRFAVRRRRSAASRDMSVRRTPSSQFIANNESAGSARFREASLIRQSELCSSVIAAPEWKNDCGEESGCRLPHGF